MPDPVELLNVTLQAISQAINTVAEHVSLLTPEFTSALLDANTLVQTGPVRVYGVSVTTAGVVGALHDAATVATAGGTNVVYRTPATVGYVNLFPGVLFNSGLVYIPGAGQVVTVFYSRASHG